MSKRERKKLARSIAAAMVQALERRKLETPSRAAVVNPYRDAILSIFEFCDYPPCFAEPFIDAGFTPRQVAHYIAKTIDHVQ